MVFIDRCSLAPISSSTFAAETFGRRDRAFRAQLAHSSSAWVVDSSIRAGPGSLSRPPLPSTFSFLGFDALYVFVGRQGTAAACGASRLFYD